MAECEHCGGSGVLNVLMSWDSGEEWSEKPYPAACHCVRGRELWGEVLD